MQRLCVGGGLHKLATISGGYVHKKMQLKSFRNSRHCGDNDSGETMIQGKHDWLLHRMPIHERGGVALSTLKVFLQCECLVSFFNFNNRSQIIKIPRFTSDLHGAISDGGKANDMSLMVAQLRTSLRNI